MFNNPHQHLYRLATLPLRDLAGFQDKVTVIKVGVNVKIKAGHDSTLAAYWAARFAGGPDMDLGDEE